MRIDRDKATEAFSRYVAAYDPSNPRIALKIAHTYRVAALCDRIARSERGDKSATLPDIGRDQDFDPSVGHGQDFYPSVDRDQDFDPNLDPDLAWLCGLLHDIGRFEQVRRYDTFNDAASVAHAALGTQVLFGIADPAGPRIRSFVSDPTEDELIACAIATHSDYRLPPSLDVRTRAYASMLRDADKIDIIKVNCICPIEDIYGVSAQSMKKSSLSPAVIRMFYEHRTIPRGVREHPADILVGHLCFAWELVHPESRRIMCEQGYLDQMLSRSFDNPKTQETFSAMAMHMRAYLQV